MAKATGNHQQAYAVRKGDTLSEIVLQRFERLGTTPAPHDLYAAVAAVARANGLRDPDLIFPGQQLDLGAVQTAQAATTVDNASTSPPAVDVLPPPVVDAALKLDAPLATHSKEETAASAPVQWAGPQDSSLRSADSQRSPAIMLAEYRPQSPWRQLIDGKARLTSEFGPREHPITGRMHEHRGIDLAARSGTPIYPLRPGTVVTSGWRGGYGNVVVVRHDDGVETLYGHNAENLVKAGDRVDGSTPMALVGSTGQATGPHLHFEVRRENEALNPIPFLTENKGAPAAGS
ncbi:MAG: M23 family metallopeptidase [Candidatus Hydrogenedentales bacterium]